MLKPALVDPLALLGDGGARPDRWVVTSYLDHPLGQSAAALAAAELARAWPGRVEPCGLLSQHVYAPNAFSERISGAGPWFRPPGGTGLGFDDLLEGLAWRPI